MFTPKNIQGALEELYDLCDPDYMVDMLVNYSEEFDDISPALLAKSFQKNAEMISEYRVLSSAGEGIDYQGKVLLNSRAVRLLSYAEDMSGDEKVRTIQSKELWLAEDMTYPYVWGGSSPSTSFDCSGFVSYVINHCGNGWSVGRLTANGLMGVCDIIPKSSAKPGDLIFFQGTYDTSGASHVGIYVGNGMMIHCGNPISYASIESNYWQQHFYCFGRIRN